MKSVESIDRKIDRHLMLRREAIDELLDRLTTSTVTEIDDTSMRHALQLARLFVADPYKRETWRENAHEMHISLRSRRFGH
jgi:hypothetical protein